MKKGRSRFRWAGILMGIGMVAICGISAQGIEALGGKRTERADVITIDTLHAFGDLERPDVVFLHDQHTDALEKQGKSCDTCHLSEKRFKMVPDTLESAIKRVDHLSPKFKRLKDEGRQEVMDIYHDECIGCHNRTADEGHESGPVTCGECHREDPPAMSNRADMGMDRSLHYRHVKAQEKKCELCHHKYDALKDKLYYAKGEEGTCRYCHEEQTEENRISMRLASHIACLDCHRKTMEKEKVAGPVRCSGCHHPEMQEKIEKVDPVPRMERNQPDALIVKISEGGEAGAPENNRMAAVPFDHKAHEIYNDTCRVCHHEEMKTCSSCHSLLDTKTEGSVNLAQAMHQLRTDTSCIGCHAEQQEAKECAGCHGFMAKHRKQPDAFCKTCHMTPVEELQKETTPEAMTAMAQAQLAARQSVDGTYDLADIPETVTMGVMAKDYEPAKMPHRKIVTSMLKKIEGNKLAAHFHQEKGTFCQGCHHNAPPSKKPPRCSSCHGKPFDPLRPDMPGLKAIYHDQCIGCHDRMGVEKPAAVDCISCHKEKTK